ncbi:unnamed protein product [Effrenium voratum]|nr:unnamed protein product [Effrenium voratum]
MADECLRQELQEAEAELQSCRSQLSFARQGSRHHTLRAQRLELELHAEQRSLNLQELEGNAGCLPESVVEDLGTAEMLCAQARCSAQDGQVIRAKAVETARILLQAHAVLAGGRAAWDADSCRELLEDACATRNSLHFEQNLAAELRARLSSEASAAQAALSEYARLRGRRSVLRKEALADTRLRDEPLCEANAHTAQLLDEAEVLQNQLELALGHDLWRRMRKPEPKEPKETKENDKVLDGPAGTRPEEDATEQAGHSDGAATAEVFAPAEAPGSRAGSNAGSCAGSVAETVPAARASQVSLPGVAPREASALRTAQGQELQELQASEPEPAPRGWRASRARSSGEALSSEEIDAMLDVESKVRRTSNTSELHTEVAERTRRTPAELRSMETQTEELRRASVRPKPVTEQSVQACLEPSRVSVAVATDAEVLETPRNLRSSQSPSLALAATSVGTSEVGTLEDASPLDATPRTLDLTEASKAVAQAETPRGARSGASAASRGARLAKAKAPRTPPPQDKARPPSPGPSNSLARAERSRPSPEASPEVTPSSKRALASPRPFRPTSPSPRLITKHPPTAVRALPQPQGRPVPFWAKSDSLSSTISKRSASTSPRW